MIIKRKKKEGTKKVIKNAGVLKKAPLSLKRKEKIKERMKNKEKDTLKKETKTIKGREFSQTSHNLLTCHI